MADIVKLKKKASDLEAKKQIDKALEVYVEIVDAYEAGDEDQPDIPLYNRVGDMLQKAGRVPEAVAIWEKAVDRYTEGGFYNPAIALCNKILRQSPGRTVIYYRLGKIHAEKGFKADARQNFLEYASRQQTAGNLDEAFRALKEFADLVPGQHDVRITLAEQLVKAERKDEAIDQLQLGYSQAKADGDDDAADRIAAKIREIDPSVEPEAKETGASSGGGGLVFLDIGDDTPTRRPSGRASAADIKRATQAVAGLELLEPVPTVSPATSAPASADAEPLVIEPTDLAIETTDLGSVAPPPPRESVVGLEVTNLAEDVPSLEPESVELIELDAVASDPSDGLPLLEPEPTISLEATALTVSDGQAQKARAVYQRVLDITPDDLRAQAAIESIPAEEAPPAPPAPASAPTPTAAADDGYVSLGDWLREDEEPKSTRMVVEEQKPTGDEAADFSDMLRKFKQGVAENVDDEDHEAHYDLGVAYKEMGLVDEAIAEFQKALRGTKERVRTLEALGNCFIEKGQLPVAATILQRAVAEPGVRDESLVGVLYLLGAIAEEQQLFADAKRHYERVFAVDIQFRDIGDRLNTVEQQLS